MTLKNLVEQRITAKQTEDAAITERRGIDAEIAKLLKDREEGTVTTEQDGYKVTVQYKVTRKVDSDALGKAWDGISDSVKAAFKWSADVQIKQLRSLESEAPVAQRFITTTPASPSVRVEIIEE